MLENGDSVKTHVHNCGQMKELSARFADPKSTKLWSWTFEDFFFFFIVKWLIVFHEYLPSNWNWHHPTHCSSCLIEVQKNKGKIVMLPRITFLTVTKVNVTKVNMEHILELVNGERGALSLRTEWSLLRGVFSQLFKSIFELFTLPLFRQTWDLTFFCLHC